MLVRQLRDQNNPDDEAEAHHVAQRRRLFRHQLREDGPRRSLHAMRAIGPPTSRSPRRPSGT